MAAPHARGTFLPVSVAQCGHAARVRNTSVPFRRLTAPRRTPGRHFCPVSVAQRGRAARLGDTYARFRRPTVPRRTPGRHLRPIPSPNGALPHARATFLPHFRSPTVPRRTLGEHFCPVPSPNGAAPHARATPTPVSVAQRGITTRSDDISAPFRRPMVPRRTLREHFRPFPSPNGDAAHARGTFLPLSVAQRGITTRSGDISAPFRRPTVHYRTLGEHFDPFPSPNGASQHARATLPPVSVAGEGGARETDGEVGHGEGEGDGHKSSRR